ncbi:MAG TPA: lysylphosphatidylglycerol synthase transmembrane domain-containing protein [Gallionellaceae bacterium]|nr:lysylphosphatidylglycerol synthase transmembrane domain-containing protein [Gallionellaceae bacterium]
MSASHTHPVMQGWRFRAMLLIVLLSAIGYLAFSLWGGWHEVVAALGKVGIAGTLIALSLSLVNYLVRFVRWQKFLAKLGHAVYWPESLRIYIAGFGLTILPGKTGEAIRSVFLKKHQVSYPESLAAFFSDQFSNLISMMLLVSVGLWAYPQAQPVIIVLGGIILAVLLFLQQSQWLKSLETFAQRKFPAKFSQLITSSIEIVLHSKRCFSLTMLLYGISLGLIAWGAEGVAFYYIMHLLGNDMGLQTALFIYAFSMLVGAISFLPGGLGGTEATMVALLMLNNIDQPHAVAATVLIRLATLWFAVALGVIAMTLPERKTKN